MNSINKPFDQKLLQSSNISFENPFNNSFLKKDLQLIFLSLCSNINAEDTNLRALLTKFIYIVYFIIQKNEYYN